MALEVTVKGPGGLTVEKGYRRILGISVDFPSNSVDVTALDYRNADARKAYPHDYIAQRHWNFQALPTPPSQKPEFASDGSGKKIFVDIEGTPGVVDFLAQPISALLPTASSETSLRDLLGAIAFAFAKTREENANAKDV